MRELVRGVAVTAATILLSCGGPAASPVPPAIVSAPSSLLVGECGGGSFAVGASGTAPLTYQWLRDGVAIPGATAGSYSVERAGLADDGARYSVEVTNGAGRVTSPEAILSVMAPADGRVLIAPGGAADAAIDAANVYWTDGRLVEAATIMRDRFTRSICVIRRGIHATAAMG